MIKSSQGSLVCKINCIKAVIHKNCRLAHFSSNLAPSDQETKWQVSVQ